MTEPSVPDVVVKRKRGVSIIWIIPIVAALIAGWIWWKALQEVGPSITISFETADGLEAGKTKVKFKDVVVGEVESVELAPDLSGVIVRASMEPEAKPYLLTSSRFWVVKPRIGASGVEGLGTLVSGAYITMEPGTEGKEQREFVGLELPPVAPADAPGLKLTLVADRLGGLGVGSPVFYRQIEVGQVERHRLTNDDEVIEVDIYVHPEFKRLVHSNTRFWNAGGIDVQMDADGLRVSMEALTSLVAGGIAFATVESTGEAASNGARFTLYENEQAAREVFETTSRFVLYFSESVRGLQVGAPVEFRGIQVGQVTDVVLEFDKQSREFHIPVHIALQQERMRIIGAPMDTEEERREVQQFLLDAGLRARLETGNLLTGALFIDLDLRPDTEGVVRGLTEEVPEIPTIPSTSSEILATVRRLPSIAEDFERTASEIAKTVSGPEVREAITNVTALTSDVRKSMAELKDDIPLAIADLRRVAGEASDAMQMLTASGQSMRADVARVIVDMSSALQSVRTLADTLERNPEALLKGKPGDS